MYERNSEGSMKAQIFLPAPGLNLGLHSRQATTELATTELHPTLLLLILGWDLTKSPGMALSLLCCSDRP